MWEERMRRFVFAVSVAALSIYAVNAPAADRNGYTAQYECRAGGPHCDVDVAGLSQQGCDQIIGSSTPWSAIDWANNTICIAAGDHTGKGILDIPGNANGTPGRYKVLRYFSNADTGDVPWRQS